ncbi:sensor histidine kinase KdpD [Amycolatopsis sp. 195334CR]|uniref:sensor histidine kinase n=1 Tax=Amycolatopsis sp. 195334CR TaxID=2814588 RepID=UPI001A8F2907|nr:ATP-binding protein [Amycolatopsis sp. 195334CR]MBN6033926.1 ATP-binding protein [Amycolatopsis sp. 195334CR]
MATRARELLDRSRVLRDRARAAAVQFLSTPDQQPVRGTRVIEAPPPPPPVDNTEQEALAGICASVALRDLNLVDSLLSQLEEMEAREEDDERLSELYRLDHLAARLRRNAENLRVLAGREAGDNAGETASVVDVIRAGMSSITHYARVSIGRVVPLGVVGFAAEDLSRLLSELLDNATGQSSPDTPVRVSAHLTEQGSVLIRIEDEGIGVPAERLAELNDRLDAEPVLDHASVRHMGLAVVRRLAVRHGMRVRLERRVPHGTTATVLLPAELVSELPEAGWSGTATVVVPSNGFTPTLAPQADAVPLARRGSSGSSSSSDSSTTTSTSGTLPKRTAGASGATATAEPLTKRKPSPAPRGEDESGGITAGGLPRRVPRSIKGTGEDEPQPPPAPEDPIDQSDGHDRLLADLGAFSDGERAALEEQQRDAGGARDENDPAKPPEGPQA